MVGRSLAPNCASAAVASLAARLGVGHKSSHGARIDWDAGTLWRMPIRNVNNNTRGRRELHLIGLFGEQRSREQEKEY